MSLKSVEKQQCETFIRERLVERVASIEKTIKNNKLHLMRAPKDSKSRNSEVKDLKNLPATLSNPYVVNQVCGEDTHDFFFFINMLNIPHQYLKTVSCIMDLNQIWFRIATHPSVDTAVIDKLAIVQMVPTKNNCTVDEYCEMYMKYVGIRFSSN